MSLSQLKLVQAAFRGEVIPRDSLQTLELRSSKEFGASAAILALARELGLDRTIYSRREPWVEDVLAMIVGRVGYAGSKLALSNQWKNTALWALCGVAGAVDVDVHGYAPDGSVAGAPRGHRKGPGRLASERGLPGALRHYQQLFRRGLLTFRC